MKTNHKNTEHRVKRPWGGRLLLFTLLTTSCFFAACRKFVEIPPPTSQLVTKSVFNNNASATSALINIYIQMFSNTNSYNIAYSTGLLSDELTNHSSNIADKGLYINAMTGTNTSNNQWKNGYSYIYQANAVIEGLQNNSGVSNLVKQQLTGEALFLRGFWHFYLANLYGDVPLITTTDYTINSVISRTPRIQVLQQVITDLKNAQKLLNANYVAIDDTSVTTEKVRPNKSVASALLAKVYLYLGDYGKDASAYKSAEDQATAVISNSALFSLETDLNRVFLANSTETIWQIQTPQPTTINTSDGNSFILLGAPTNKSSNSTTISPQLMNAFEPGDQRKTDWIGFVTTASPVATYYFPYKYKVRTGATISEYTMVLRLAEQYLIRAEARAQQGNLAGGNSSISDLNTIRNRAGLPAYAGATDKASVLAAILHERQVELFTEWGSRWFDLNRTGNTNAVMSIVTPLKGGTWSTDGHQLLFPIPQSERNLDPNLTQNAGY